MNSLIYASVLSFIMCFFGLKYFIILLKKHNKFQPIRAEGPESHILTKAKTPTMGGVVITLSILTSMLCFCNLKLPYIQVMIGFIIIFSIVGLLDDVFKVFLNNTKGFAGAKKLIIQLITASVGVLYLMSANIDYLTYQIHLPILNFDINFGCLLAAIYVLIICGSSNASNITDGLDGLLSVPIIFISVTYIIMILLMLNGYTFSNIIISQELLYNLLIVLCSVVFSFGCFMIYNHHPAKIFMGDVASLMIGALLCYISILLKVEVLYGIMSILFIVEIMSTVLQVACYKITHGQKRLFKMAPFHHHLEKCGWSETKIVWSMWAFVFVCCVISLGLFLL